MKCAIPVFVFTVKLFVCCLGIEKQNISTTMDSTEIEDPYFRMLKIHPDPPAKRHPVGESSPAATHSVPISARCIDVKLVPYSIDRHHEHDRHSLPTRDECLVCRRHICIEESHRRCPLCGQCECTDSRHHEVLIAQLMSRPQQVFVSDGHGLLGYQR